MYVALWINPQPEKADERIVICYPLLARQNAAVAVLRSAMRQNAESAILSADIKDLQHFLGLLDKADDSWDFLSDQELIAAVEQMAKKYRVSVVDWEADAHVVTAVRKIPKPKLYPRFITPEGKKVWDEMFETYKKTLNKYKSNKQRMWVAALIIFRRLGAEQGIKVLSKEPMAEDRSRSMSQKEINKRANNGNAKALTETEKVFEYLYGEGLVSRLTNEKFFEVARYDSRYYITTYRWCKLRKGVKPIDVIQKLLRERGYNGKPGKYAHKRIDGVTDLLIEPEGKDVYFYITTFLTKDQIILLFGFDDEGAKDEIILKKLKTAGRKWVRTGVLVEPK